MRRALVLCLLLSCSKATPSFEEGVLEATVHEDRLELQWPKARGDDLIAIGVLVNGQLAEEIAPTATSYIITERDESATTMALAVVARRADNAFARLDATLTLPDQSSPEFGEGVSLTLRQDEDKLHVSWPAATDNVGVAQYSVRVDDEEAATTTELEAVLEGLDLDAQHAVAVIATDEAGNTSEPLSGQHLSAEILSILSQATGVMVGDASGSVSGTLRIRGDGPPPAFLEQQRTAPSIANLAMQGLGELGASSRMEELRVRGQVRVELQENGGAGDYDQSIVNRMVRVRIRAMQRCYERELRTTPNLEGRIQARFTIVVEGRVQAASVLENTASNQALGVCVVNVLRRLRFNPGPEAGPVTYTASIVLTPLT